MPKKSNNDKKKEAEAAGKAPKQTKQQVPFELARPCLIQNCSFHSLVAVPTMQENAGKSQTAKKAEMKAAKAAKGDKTWSG
jgi:hypothetical protein